ncbi:hypothetical protein [Pyrobaculum islandicum]|uniref:hypothetical protein n=1 Tax=Pyrobaculum islandicum TaxID=2277 RepID=UPI000B28E642|nr:hypothetical protein [Pyrobaculum islandicum]
MKVLEETLLSAVVAAVVSILLLIFVIIFPWDSLLLIIKGVLKDIEYMNTFIARL